MKMTTTQKRQRLQMMLFGAFAIFFTGYPHIWSVYQPYVMKEAGWSQGQASMCFYLALAMFVFGNIVGGRIQDKKNPRLAVFLGGGIFTVGILLSSQMIISSPLPMYATYGVMQGFGQGMIYTTIISTAQKWFPGRTGFASGIVVTANGLCGFFLAPISRSLLETSGASKTLLIIGIVIGISWVLSSIFFFVPDETWRKEMEEELQKKSGKSKSVSQKQYTASEMMHTKQFYYLLATMLFGLISYFLVSPVSQSYQLDMGIPANIAVSAVMFGSIVNACTRLILPTIADKWGRIICIKGILILTVFSMLGLAFTSSYFITASIILIYGCYGGIMGSFPSFTSAIFGLKHSGENYGYVMFGIVIATFGAPILTSVLTGNGFNMRIVFGLGVIFAMIAYSCLYFLEKELKEDIKTKERK